MCRTMGGEVHPPYHGVKLIWRDTGTRILEMVPPDPLDFGLCQVLRDQALTLYLEGRPILWSPKFHLPPNLHSHARPDMMLKSLLLSCLLLEATTAQRWTWIRTQPQPTPTPTPTPTVAAPGAVQTLYGQCEREQGNQRSSQQSNHSPVGGGQTYTGPTQCPPGSYCKNDGK